MRKHQLKYREDLTSPPAPFLEARFYNPADDQKEEFSMALLDSGAAMCVIPERMARELQLELVRDDQDIVTAKGGGKSKVYWVGLKLNKFFRKMVEVIARPEQEFEDLNYILIGRDILNQWTLLLNGPKKMLEIT